ncbi:unnamed protein product [Blumeria hordei]|uniref:Uncharacterized protein n=1 Tax=Blumeria hordei TaxID=2867405 RepID=A0A383UUL7_BLUHO|nr:unnamed protein product [Blumeria hordei]
MEDMSQRLIQPIFWPANLPDLDPIEAVSNRMKDNIQRYHANLGGGKQRNQECLRNIVKEALDSVSPEGFVRLIESMPARCQALIDTHGIPTRF